jgi:dehydrogenase/reductase SDR family member 12
VIGALDDLLDRTVIAGYSRLGYALRSAGWREPLPRMDGRVVAVTGASSGIGLAAAMGLAGLGATMWLIVRDTERGEDVRSRVADRADGGDVRLAQCDLSELESVRRCADRLIAESERLDVLVNNAGVLTEHRELSRDGIELTFAVNVLAPFLLTQRLTPLLSANAPARVINTSSGGMYARRLNADDLQSEQGEFSGATAYARTKRAEVVLTELWAERLRGTGVVVHAMHPGWVNTPGLAHALPGFHRLTGPILRTPAQGADTIVWLGAAREPLGSSGGFWHDRRRRSTHHMPWTHETPDDRQKLWDACERLTARAG